MMPDPNSARGQGWISVLAEGEEANVLGQELSVDRMERWGIGARINWL